MQEIGPFSDLVADVNTKRREPVNQQSGSIGVLAKFLEVVLSTIKTVRLRMRSA